MKVARAGMIFFLTLLAAAPVTGPDDVEDLKQKALSENFNVSKVALKALIAKGVSAKPAVREVVKELLTRDKAKIEENAALLGDSAEYKELDQKLVAQRKVASENIAVLEREKTVKEASENYHVLGELWKGNAAPLRSAIFDAMKRRPELLSIWRQTPATENPFPPSEEMKLIPLAEKALGMTLMQASGLSAANERNVPKEPAKWNFWFYRMCRQIEAYNASFENLLDKEEMVNVRATNAYREALGILPVELDARLIQAARRHSKEMVELKYFSHHSPNPSEKDFERRYLNAGFKDLGSENIAMGMSSGEAAFKIWFESPGHHVNMVRPGNTALGVGRWKNYWTANFGNGPRMMSANETERNRVAVKGEIIKPDVDYVEKEERRGLPGLPAELFDK
ncbi:MAG TPA: CAP domain-containing protein [Tepidisphaeraceae bacterium]|nr:CAP domain-containing protein [Tepidisphaeraceae bacterium]